MSTSKYLKKRARPPLLHCGRSSSLQQSFLPKSDLIQVACKDAVSLKNAYWLRREVNVSDNRIFVNKGMSFETHTTIHYSMSIFSTSLYSAFFGT